MDTRPGNSFLTQLIIMSLLGFFMAGCGSGSSDFTPVIHEGITNPLPPCPDSPNCVRITRMLPDSLQPAWERVRTALREMKPYRMEVLPDENRIETVFMVVFFQDDLVIQLEPSRNGDGTLLHIRSASRIGYSDLGVNTRRVRRLLEQLDPGQ